MYPQAETVESPRYTVVSDIEQLIEQWDRHTANAEATARQLEDDWKHAVNEAKTCREMLVSLQENRERAHGERSPSADAHG